MKFIEVTSFIKNEDYSEVGGLQLKNQMEEIPALLNVDLIAIIYPSKNGIAKSMIKLTNGMIMDVKETLKELETLIHEEKKKK